MENYKTIHPGHKSAHSLSGYSYTQDLTGQTLLRSNNNFVQGKEKIYRRHYYI
jgi:hypothetical protein